ncbi:uncharacterized protein FA14DRAFT_182194 [Meira miltonrushii]|uniref:Uncharacterized protein n=1 Tax=Meira miltonrushii TaxID=1280837 RepID=A0A316V9W5_9BASI|nr:uncharacterized protein FA14DRAFT_182194 [Meira miltonrushii]PWN32285.1 hypothetical protein FA14DRAFT_182194 [Meira miltonrushii]
MQQARQMASDFPWMDESILQKHRKPSFVKITVSSLNLVQDSLPRILPAQLVQLADGWKAKKVYASGSRHYPSFYVEPDQAQRQWRNLSDPKEYEKWAAYRRDKPEDWKRYKDERLGGALSGGMGAEQREYWKAKDALRGVETQATQQQQ